MFRYLHECTFLPAYSHMPFSELSVMTVMGGSGKGSHFPADSEKAQLIEKTLKSRSAAFGEHPCIEL